MFSGCIKGTPSAVVYIYIYISLWFLVKIKLNFKQLDSVEAI